MQRILTILFMLIALAYQNQASATDIFKCSVDGKTTYQSQPCDAKASSVQLHAEPKSSLTGCYSTTVKGLEDGVIIRKGGKSPYEMVFTEGANTDALPMKISTRHENRQIASAFGIKIDEGISMEWPRNTPNQRPVGLYKGRDLAGKNIILVYLFFSSAYVTKSTCKRGPANNH